MTGMGSDNRGARILHLIDSLRIGGKERQTVELLKGLARVNSIQQMVVTMDDEQFYVPDVQALGIPLEYLIRKTRWDLGVFPRLYRVLRDFRPDIVHSNSGMAITFALPLCWMMGIKVINGTIRNAFSGRDFRWQWSKLILWLSDARVANSKAGFASRGWKPDARGNHVIYNGFDMARFDNSAIAGNDVLGFDPGPAKIVGMVAEFSDYKDFPTFIRAAEKILARRKNVIFVMVGDGKTMASCQQMVSPQNKEAIRFLGRRKNVESLVRRMDIGALCTFTEGISNSVMEFMAASKPVVVTDGGGSSELISDQDQGFLVRSKDMEAVAEKIEWLLDNPDAAARMGASGRRRLETSFSLEQLVERNIQIYHELLRPPSAPQAGLNPVR
jgi:glycosyltransferase involved in cell wall biosynthesis